VDLVPRVDRTAPTEATKVVFVYMPSATFMKATGMGVQWPDRIWTALLEAKALEPCGGDDAGGDHGDDDMGELPVGLQEEKSLTIHGYTRHEGRKFMGCTPLDPADFDRRATARGIKATPSASIGQLSS